MRCLLSRLIGSISVLALSISLLGSAAAQTTQTNPEQSSKYFSAETVMLDNGASLVKYTINGPPKPPPGYELERSAVELPESDQEMATKTLIVPAYSWIFGCASVSGAMIAAYYDRTEFPNIYTGPTNSGVMPLDSSSWPEWTDGDNETYRQNPLIASHNGLDGRVTRGSLDDYWVYYLSGVQDPYITNGWSQHTWGDAIGDYMKTSQSAFNNNDGSTYFYWYNNGSPLTCNDMVTNGIQTQDGTYGRKLFYEAKGYTVTDCYCQKTNNNGGGFTFAMFKAEIDANRPVMLNLAGHTIVGVGYDDSSNTVYLHDTWDYLTHTMTWGGSYSGMALQSVSVVNLATGSTSTTTSVSTSTTSSVAPTTTTTSVITTTTAPVTTTAPATTTTTTPIVTTTTTSVSGKPCPAKNVLGENNPNLENLRILRDGPLAQSAVGRRITQIYYNNADSINAALERSPALRAVAKKFFETVSSLVKQ